MTTTTDDTRSRIILDCDPGYDDAVAIMLAAGSPKIEVLAVTTVAGNQSIDKVTRNALRLVGAAGLTDVPVAQGARRPLLKEVKVCPEIHGETGLDGTSLTDAFNPEQLDPRPAAQLIVDIIMREPAKTVTLVPTGPLTNIALAARLEPRIVERVKEVVLMGGGVGIGNVKPFAEFNIENDPEAAAIVFGEPWKVVMVGLDLTYQARAVKSVRDRMLATGTHGGKIVYEILEAFGAKYLAARGFDAPPLHDPCAVAHVIDPECVQIEPMPIAVETRGALTAGMTVADRRRPAPEGCHTFAAMKLDEARLWSMLEDALKRLP